MPRVTTRKRTSRDNFFKSHERNCITEMSFSYSQNIQIYYLSGKYKFSNRYFLEYWCRIIFVHNTVALTSKRMFFECYKRAQHFFRAESDDSVFNTFTCVTKSLSIFNEILFSIKHIITIIYNLMNFELLTVTD